MSGSPGSPDVGGATGGFSTPDDELSGAVAQMAIAPKPETKDVVKVCETCSY